MTNKIILMFLTWVLIHVQSLAQQYADEIITYDKKTYTGIIVEQKLGEHIRILLKNSQDTILIKMEDIDQVIKKLDQAPVKEQEKKSNIASNQTFNKRFISPELSYSIGGGDVNHIGLGFMLFARIKERMQTGISVQYFGEVSPELRRAYQWQKIPLTAEFQYDLQNYFNKRASIFFKTNIGYSFTLNGTYYDEFNATRVHVSDGVFFSPGIGFRCNVLENTGIKIEVNYQLTVDRDITDEGEVISTNKWNNINLKSSLFF